MSQTIQPLGARVLLEILDEDSVTASGLVIPDTAKEKQQRGVVVAVGEDEDDLIKVSTGDTVLFPKYSGTEISLQGKEFLIIDATELLGNRRFARCPGRRHDRPAPVRQPCWWHPAPSSRRRAARSTARARW